MGGMSYPMNLNNLNYQKYPAEELVGIKIALINALEQLDMIIYNMEQDLIECDCEDGCCK
jgi:hypothetical protein